MKLLMDLLEFMMPYGTYSYFVMFGILIACGFGFPMPEDIVLITGGILAARGVTDVLTVNVVCMLGVLIGDGTVFFMGRRFGHRIKSFPIIRKVLNEKTDKRVEHIFNKYGKKVIFFARFMPGLRTPIFMTSGIYRVSPWTFLILDGFAALISVPLWIHVGYLFGKNLEDLEKKMQEFQLGFYVILVVVIALIVGVNLAKKRTYEKMANGNQSVTEPKQ
jgi:membrane protein DedA with SNARE-associated domain